MIAMDNVDSREANVFPDTPRTLIRRIPELSAGKDDGAWERFVDIYEPALRHFVALAAPAMPSADADDIVQDTFIRLVDVLRSGSYDPSRARFRTYLATITRRIVIDRFRRNATQQAIRQSACEAAAFDDNAPPDPADAAKALGIPANTASKVKRRIETMVAAVEAEFDDACTHEK